MSRLNENDRKIWPKFAKYVHFFPQEDETNIHFCMYVLTYTQSLHFLFVSNRDGSSLNLTFLLRKCSRCILTFVEKRRLSPTLIASRLPKIKHEYLRSRAYICLSLSSPFSSPVMVSQLWPLSRSRAAILDPCIQGIFRKMFVRPKYSYFVHLVQQLATTGLLTLFSPLIWGHCRKPLTSDVRKITLGIMSEYIFIFWSNTLADQWVLQGSCHAKTFLTKQKFFFESSLDTIEYNTDFAKLHNASFTKINMLIASSRLS